MSETANYSTPYVRAVLGVVALLGIVVSVASLYIETSGFSPVSLGAYLGGLAAVLLSGTTEWGRRHARLLLMAVTYGVTLVDILQNASGSDPNAAMWICVIGLGGSIAIASLAHWTPTLAAYTVVRTVTAALAMIVGDWPSATAGLVLLAMAALDILIIVLAWRRLRSERARQHVISALRAREAELVDALEAAEQSNRVKSAFLAAMSHEIRTPLTGVLGASELLLAELASAESAPGSPAERSETIALARVVHRGGTRLLHAFDSVMSLAQLDAGTAVLSPLPVDLSAVVRRAAAPFIGTSHLAVTVHVPDSPLLAVVDAAAVTEVVEHLVRNAVAFTPSGSVRVELRCGPEGAQVCVADTGPGIDPAHQELIFEPFRQVSEGHGRTAEGVGLGLALVARLAQAMGGVAAVESRVGAGSRFEVQIPLHPRPPARPAYALAA